MHCCCLLFTLTKFALLIYFATCLLCTDVDACAHWIPLCSYSYFPRTFEELLLTLWRTQWVLYSISITCPLFFSGVHYLNNFCAHSSSLHFWFLFCSLFLSCHRGKLKETNISWHSIRSLLPLNLVHSWRVVCPFNQFFPRPVLLLSLKHLSTLVHTRWLYSLELICAFSYALLPPPLRSKWKDS